MKASSILNISTIFALIALVLVYMGKAEEGGIVSLATGLLLIIGILTTIGIYVGGLGTNDKGSRIFVGILTFLSIIMILNGGTSAPASTLDLSDSGYISEDTPIIIFPPESKASAALKLNVKNSTGGVYASAGTIYAMPPGTINDEKDLMKIVSEGKTGNIATSAMTLSSGVFTAAGYSASVGDTVVFAGYQDSTPAAAENISFVAKATITGISAGSTPEWMISQPNYIWYNYPTLAYYNYADTAVTAYKEDEDTAIEKSITFSMFPTLNGEQWRDATLWIEAPAASINIIKSVTITPESGTAVTYSGVPSEVTSSENLFRAMPALTTATDTMYKVGDFPNDGLLRTSTSQKGRQTITVVYDHPATTGSDVLLYFKTTQNSHALTTSGGHYDSPATNFALNVTADGTDAWT